MPLCKKVTSQHGMEEGKLKLFLKIFTLYFQNYNKQI